VLIPVFGSQPAGDVSHKPLNPGGRLPLLSTRPAVALKCTVFPARRYASAGILAMALCLCLSVSVTSRCSFEANRAGFFCMGASFHLSYIVL